jgi:hypothetical protein
MLLGSVGVLFAIALFFYVRTWRAILIMVHACRAEDPSRRFSRLWWIPAWRYHKRRFPESDVRKKIVVNYALTWVGMGSFLALLVVAALRGHWPS